jgi:hypothetical protein
MHVVATFFDFHMHLARRGVRPRAWSAASCVRAYVRVGGSGTLLVRTPALVDQVRCSRVRARGSSDGSERAGAVVDTCRLLVCCAGLVFHLRRLVSR